MAWQAARAEARIRRFMENVPEGEIVVEDFARFLAETRMIKAAAGGIHMRDSEALLQIPRNRAITTDAAHVYANLVDFNSVLVDAGRETEASHRRALQFLHAHYSACDSLISEFGMVRVDFHGSRLHAVVLSPEGAHNEAERVRTAVAFAAAFRKLVERWSDEHPEFRTRVRVGIDTGPAIAIDSGKKDEPEPLFIGSPANHAAKLAAGDEEGVVLSRRARMLLAQDPEPISIFTPMSKMLEGSFLDEKVEVRGASFAADSRLEAAYTSLKEQSAGGYTFDSASAVFRFHHKEPPLRVIVFAEHPPSNAIRMTTASLFADIDGFTAYIDQAIATGQIAQAVANLHVMRAEMAAVLRDDFDGRKVRFVGDCIHGLLAEGNAREIDAMATVRSAVMASAGLRSSFELCRRMLPGAHGLGLAIGIDFGATPICRLGLRGASSVRTAASRSSCVSEAEQQRCNGTETALGADAYAAAPAVVRQIFASDRKVPNLDHDSAELLLGTMQSPYIASSPDTLTQAHEPDRPPMRAYTAK